MELIGAGLASERGYGDNLRKKLIYGAQEVVKVAKDSFGFESKIQAVPSLPLGANNVKPIEMAEAYSVFMNHGTRVKPFSVVKVVGPDGLEINLKGLKGPIETPNVLGHDVCNVMDSLLEEVVLHGTGTAAAIVPGAHGKTGTTNDNKDAWFCGYTRGLVGIGWVGNEVLDRNKNWVPKPMARDAFGGTITAGMWAKIMSVAVKKFVASQLERPAPPKSKPIDKEVPAIGETGQNDAPDGLRDSEPVVQDPKPPVEDPAGTATESSDPLTAPLNPGGGVGGAPKPNPPGNTPGTKPSPPDVEVTVDICEDSLLLASLYCPQTISRTFKKADAPKKKCNLHKPPPP